MKRWGLTVVVLLASLSWGCGYRAHIRGVFGPDDRAPIESSASICVKQDPETKFDSELSSIVGEKLEWLLIDRGFTIASENEADYFLFYDCEVRSLTARVRLQPTSGIHSGIMTTPTEGPFDQTLSLRLVHADRYREQGMEEFAWAGGAILDSTPTANPRFVDLLLVAGMRHFQRDTKEVVDMRVGLYDSRARRLRNQDRLLQSAVEPN